MFKWIQNQSKQAHPSIAFNVKSSEGRGGGERQGCSAYACNNENVVKEQLDVLL